MLHLRYDLIGDIRVRLFRAEEPGCALIARRFDLKCHLASLQRSPRPVLTVLVGTRPPTPFAYSVIDVISR